MKIWLDCEFNSWGGELISFALVAEDGKEFYAVLPCIEPKPWVKENVIPNLRQQPVSKKEAQNELRLYLGMYSDITIYATWPDDFRLFMDMLIVGDGLRIKTPQITMVLLNHTKHGVEVMKNSTHNALDDARLMRIAYP